MKSHHDAHLYYWLCAVSTLVAVVIHEGLAQFKYFEGAVALPFVEIASPFVVFSAFLYLFDQHGWKLGWLCRLLQVPQLPDLNGEWTVKGVSSFRGPTTGKPIEWQGTATIDQHWSKLSVQLKTSSSTSMSQTAVLWEEPPAVTLLYDYLNEPNKQAPGRLMKHRGTTRLAYHDDVLEGSYYNETRERGTDGTMVLTRVRQENK